MPAAYSTITLESGATVCTLTDGTNYQLVDGGWAPSVAALRLSTLGGQGSYEDVTEEITVNVLGATGAACLANLAKLANLLDQAERWARGDVVAPVLMTVQPQGSTLTAPLKCAILGRSGDSAMTSPVTFNDRLMIYEISDVRLRFRRRGLWLGGGGSKTSTPVANPGPFTVTFDDSAPIAAPLKLSLQGGNVIGAAMDVVILAGNLQVLEAETFYTGGVFTSVAEAATFARGGAVLRYTPTDTSWQTTQLPAGTLTLAGGCRGVAVYAAVRNNSTTVDFTVRLSAVGENRSYSGNEVVIAAGATTPRLVLLGQMRIPEEPQNLTLAVQASGSGGTAKLDIDYICVLDITSRFAKSIVIRNNVITDVIVVDPSALSYPAARVWVYDVVDGFLPVSWFGSAYLEMTGAELKTVCMLYVVGSANWRYAADGSAKTFTSSADRPLAYLTPQ